MAYDQSARHFAKTEPVKSWFTPQLKQLAKKAAAEEGKQLSTWLRDIAVHALTMKEVSRRLEDHSS